MEEQHTLYNGNNSYDRNNVFYLENEIIFPSGNTAILYNIESKQKRFLKGHTDRISSLTVNSLRNMVATGQVNNGDNVTIMIWDLKLIRSLGTIKVGKYSGIIHLEFSPDNTKLLAIAKDDKSSIFIWDTKSLSLIISSPNTYQTLGASFNPYNSSSIISWGDKHVSFWTVNETLISRKRGMLGQEFSNTIIQSCLMLPNDTQLFGTNDGSLLVFKANNLVQILKISGAPIYQIKLMRDKKGILIASDDTIYYLDETIKIQKQVLSLKDYLPPDETITNVTPTTASKIIHSIDMDNMNNIIIGTLSNEIYQSSLSKPKKIDLILKGQPSK
ncbi:hypothetical protein DLAC_09164 [Tieghemostelium lacteum]|uniref:EML-like first beta-propeller domain-containing protein n=1 Tax=Tieghemostelium lacteum TaxID=361077 RepID=A0A151Z9B4_TIELA|nr:hypothetical protein DLAC_09164 [Tieghemostelium lacteum]|eukprot:KYQ90539.1 hypothetical protein DLAC_09164 [Tieghemostelium lacteum]